MYKLPFMHRMQYLRNSLPFSPALPKIFIPQTISHPILPRRKCPLHYWKSSVFTSIVFSCCWVRTVVRKVPLTRSCFVAITQWAWRKAPKRWKAPLEIFIHTHIPVMDTMPCFFLRNVFILRSKSSDMILCLFLRIFPISRVTALSGWLLRVRVSWFRVHNA